MSQSHIFFIPPSISFESTFREERLRIESKNERCTTKVCLHEFFFFINELQECRQLWMASSFVYFQSNRELCQSAPRIPLTRKMNIHIRPGGAAMRTRDLRFEFSEMRETEYVLAEMIDENERRAEGLKKKKMKQPMHSAVGSIYF